MVDLCTEIDNLCAFIQESLQNLNHNEVTQQVWNIKWLSNKTKSKKISNGKTSTQNSANYSKDICWKSHISFTTDRNTPILQIQWRNDFILSTESEVELLHYIKCDILLVESTQIQTNNELYHYILGTNHVFTSSELNHKLASNPHMFVKTIQMFLNRLQQNNTQCFRTLIKHECKWWRNQMTLDVIDYVAWFEKCEQYCVSPVFIIKQYMKQKRVFLNYQISSQLEEKIAVGKIPKILTTFIEDITAIPLKHKQWRDSVHLQRSQYLVCWKWIRYATHVHRMKYCKYLRVKCENEAIHLPEFELQNENKNMYNIPNIEHVLCEEMCEAITNLCILDKSLSRKSVKIKKRSKKFEQIICRKLLDVLQIYNNTNVTKLELLNEKSIRKMHKKSRNNSESVTPDLLFSSAVYINKHDVQWIDAKCFFLSENDVFGCAQVMKSIKKYVEVYGNGAIICCGFVETFPIFIDKFLSQNNLNKYSVLILDASTWIRNFSDIQ